MSIRIVPAILTAALSVALNFLPALAQQPQRPQPPRSVRLYVLDCGRITPANADAFAEFMLGPAAEMVPKFASYFTRS